MTRNQRRKVRIKEQIPIAQLLCDLGYRVRPDAAYREQQFPCDLHGDGQDDKPSARVYPNNNAWYCVSVIEPVLTSGGWKPLGQLNPGFSVLDGSNVWCPLVANVPKGQRQVVRLETIEGYSAILTPDHEVFLPDGRFLPVAFLKPGDRVALMIPSEPSFSDVTDLPFSVEDLNALQRGRKLALPAHWSQELGEAMGFIFGDGWIRRNPNFHEIGITSCVDDADDARTIFRYLQKITNSRGSERFRTDQVTCNGRVYNQRQVVWGVYSRGLRVFFSRLGLDKALPCNERRIPSSIWGAPETAIRGFLRGIFATDGSVTQSKGRESVRVKLYSVSRGFLWDVQLLLLQFGIRSRVYAQTPGRSLRYLQITSCQGVELFRDRIGIANRRKQNRLNCHVTKIAGCQKPFATIKDITPWGSADVGDIVMPSDPSFSVGGIRVHNCFAESVHRDAIRTVRDKLGLTFTQALKWLEEKYGLPPMPFEDTDYQQRPSLVQKISQEIDPAKTYEDDRARFSVMLDNVTHERVMDLEDVASFWEALDKLTYLLSQGAIDESTARKALLKIRVHLREAWQEALSAGPVC